MTLEWPSRAQVFAPQEPRVEALQQLRVEPASLHVAQRRRDVQPDQVVVLLAGRHPELGHLEPLLDRLPDRDRRLGVLPLVDLAKELGECDLSLAH